MFNNTDYRDWETAQRAVADYITHRNGAEWQAETFHRIDEQMQPLDRREALREMLRRYVEHMHSNVPVDSWPTG